MTDILLYISIILNIVVLILLVTKRTGTGSDDLNDNFSALVKGSERLEKCLKDEMMINRKETAENGKMSREEISGVIKSFGDSVDRRMSDFANMQNKSFDSFSKKLSEVTERNEQKIEKVRETVEKRLDIIQKDNSEKLEKMRATVDEKLHQTLERRLGESFKLVSERLELVHKGLGEMQNLATGVGDLKKVLQNVKTRGTWGEVQLGSLLEQILTTEQYAKNVVTKKGSNERVEFAIKFHPKTETDTLWLPIDAKFPLEDYQALVEAEGKGDLASIDKFSKALELRIKGEAKDIKEKYLDPPNTTDFGILFLPIEGLYAEILKRPGLVDTLQREYKVMITGPTTIYAILNSLQMGFRTLAITKRSSEVWKVLSAVKTEFSKFGAILEKTQKKLQEATNTIEDAASKTRNIERKLSKVQELPAVEEQKLSAPEEQMILPPPSSSVE